jgi:hypothetical protein
VRLIRIVGTTIVSFLVVAATALAGTPYQTTYNSSKELYGTPFRHGDNMSVVITRRYLTGWPTQINFDCAGTLAKYGHYPKYQIKRYGREGMESVFCGEDPNVQINYERQPYAGPQTSRLYHRRKVRAIRYACRSVRKETRRFRDKQGHRYRVRCRHLKLLDSGRQRTVVGYYTPRRRSVFRIVMIDRGNGKGKLRVINNNGFDNTYYGRFR